jgi:hypothetical protein
MRIETKAAAVLTVVILLSGYANVACADDSLATPQAIGLPNPCGTSQTNERVDCRTTGGDQAAARANVENAEAEFHRNERTSARVKGAFGGAFFVAAGILKLGVIGVAACAIYPQYCVALVLVGASVGAVSARG